MSFDISGVYMTSWQQPNQQFTVGPVVVVAAGSNSVTVDGYSIANPIFAGTVITWQAAAGNSSSGALSFYQNNGSNGFTGSYVQGTGPLPQTSNLFGVAQQPAQQLSAWNATYNTFNLVNGTSTKEGTLIVASPNVVHDNTSVQNYVYTGETTPNGPLQQLAWFVQGGNKENAIIQFAKDKSGDLTFYGTRWTTGPQPNAVNFTGTTASTPPSNQTINIVAAVITINSTTTQTNTSVDVSVDVSVAVDVAVAVAVLAADVTQTSDPDAPGTQKLSDASEDSRAAGDLYEKSLRLSSPPVPR